MSQDDRSPDETAPDRRSKLPEKPQAPSLNPKAAADKVERAERVAAEMRKNLLKRKQQQRSKQNEV